MEVGEPKTQNKIQFGQLLCTTKQVLATLMELLRPKVGRAIRLLRITASCSQIVVRIKVLNYNVFSSGNNLLIAVYVICE